MRLQISKRRVAANQADKRSPAITKAKSFISREICSACMQASGNGTEPNVRQGSADVLERRRGSGKKEGQLGS